MKDIQDKHAYLNGQQDCQKGVKAKEGQHEDYYRGYSFEYEREQVMDEVTRWKHVI